MASTPADGRTLRIATRASELARWQAHHVAGLLRAAHPGLGVELVPLSTEGDRRTDVPLSEIGGKGVFATEVQAAVLDGRADVAVHSAKDLPAATADGLVIAAVPARGDPRDALVGAALRRPRAGRRRGHGVGPAPGAARRRWCPGCGSPSCGATWPPGWPRPRASRPSWWPRWRWSGWGWRDRFAEVLDADAVVPQVGQGALAVECRAAEEDTRGIVAAIEHPGSRRTVDCERAFLAELGGDCSLPAGAHASEQPDGSLRLDAVLAGGVPGAAGPGPAPQRATAAGHDGWSLGTLVARELRARVEASTP